MGEFGKNDSQNEPQEETSSQTLAEQMPPQYMQSVEHVLDDIGEVKALETSIAHFSLGYVGTFDCLAEYRGTLCLIDWKTSGKLKSSLADCYDYPLQAVAYAGAINQDPKIDHKVWYYTMYIPSLLSHTLSILVLLLSQQYDIATPLGNGRGKPGLSYHSTAEHLVMLALLWFLGALFEPHPPC